MAASKLTSLQLQGFKSIGNEQTIRFGDVTIFIGANGAGKSNLMSFFKMLNFMMAGSLAQFVAANGEAESFTHLGNTTIPIDVKLSFEREMVENAYEFHLNSSLQNKLYFVEEVIIRNNITSIYPHSQFESTFQNFDLKEDGLEIEVKEILNILEKCKFFQFHDTSLDSAIRRDGYVNNSDTLMQDAGNLAAFLYGLQHNRGYGKYYRRIVESVQLAYPQFKDFMLTPKLSNPNNIRLDWQDNNSPPHYRFGPHQLSDGTIRFMALATLLLQPPQTIPNIIVIDEPELSLHPSAISLLANMIHAASKNCQVIIATQSAQLLDYFEPENIRVVERDGSNTIIKEPSEEELNSWLNDYSLGQIWEKNILGGRP